jgi:hypothetical protein
MTIGVLALVGVTPERVAALTAAGYAVREGKKSANRTDAVREAADTVRAVLTNGRGGLSGDEMALLRSSRSSAPLARAMKRSIWPPPGAGASWSPIAPTRTPPRSPTPR